MNDRSHVGQTREEFVKADVDELAALDLRSSRFFLAHTVLLFSCICQPFWVIKNAPGWTVYSNLVPHIDADVKGFQRSLESVLEALLLPTN